MTTYPYVLTLQDVTIELDPASGDYVTIKQPEGSKPTTVVHCPELVLEVPDVPEGLNVQYTGPITVNVQESEGEANLKADALLRQCQEYQRAYTSACQGNAHLRAENGHLESDNEALGRALTETRLSLAEECKVVEELEAELNVLRYERDRAIEDLSIRLGDALGDIEELAEAYIELWFKDYRQRLFTGMDAPATDYECPPLFPAPFGGDLIEGFTAPKAEVGDWFSEARNFLQQALERRS